MDMLKFNDIVTRAELNGSTAAYALKHPEHLAGMPEAGSQGRHREFSVRQAVRLSICVHLVMAGVSLTLAGKAAALCDKRRKELGSGRPVRRGASRRAPTPTKEERESYLREPNEDPWILRLQDGHWMRVWRDDYRGGFAGHGEFVDIRTGEWESMPGDRFTVFELNLSMLEWVLVKPE